MKKKHSLAFVRPELLKEWDYDKNFPLLPHNVTKSSAKKVWWKCKKGHSFQTPIHERKSGCGCPYCSGRRVCKDNCLYTDNPLLSKEWNSAKNGLLTPYDVTKSSGRKGWCNCDFYIPSENKYIEVTGYSKKWKHWQEYLKNIDKKKNYITNTLKSNFEFVKIKLISDQIKYVRENVV